MTIAIMGAGGVGCYYGAMLARAGHGVTLIARPQHVEAIERHGLAFEARGTTETLPVKATTEPSGVAEADIVLFCVKSGDTEEAGRAIAPHLTQPMPRSSASRTASTMRSACRMCSAAR